MTPIEASARWGLSLGEAALAAAHDGLGDALRTTRFLRGRLEFRPRADDIFVATYPRSGTTWVQFILYLLTSDRKMDFEHISQPSPWWERSLSLGYRRAEDFEAWPSPRIFKSHLPRRWLPREGRFIYVWRDGLDVAASYHHFYRSHLRYSGDFEAFFEAFLRGRLQYGSWFKHVEGWRRFEGSPNVLLLRYESLLSDLAGSVERIARFLDWTLSPEDTRAVLEMSSFAFMKEHEAQFDPITELLLERRVRTGRFIRRGQSGAGAEVVTDSMRARFNAARARRLRRPDLETWIPDFLH